MPLTDSLATVTRYLFDKFDSLQDALGLQDVFYGDQDSIPRSPCLCVEPGPKNRVIGGVNRRSDNTFYIYLILYHSEVRSSQANMEEVTLLAEQIEAVVHQDPRLGGLVTHCFCSEVAPGYARKATGGPMRAARITVEAMDKTNIPPIP
jgi:hypothetical protein